MVPLKCAPSASASSPETDTASGVAGGSASEDDSGLSGRTLWTRHTSPSQSAP